MNIVALILGTLLFPLVSWVFNAFVLRRLKLERIHDRMLYRLCAVRDTAALLAIDEKMQEESQLFSFFYIKTARVIHEHNHKKMGLCFRTLIRAYFSLGPISRNEALVSELTNSFEPHPEVKYMAKEWCKAIEEGYEAAYPFIKMDRFVRIIQTFQLNLLRHVASLVTPTVEEKSVYDFSILLRRSMSSSEETLHPRMSEKSLLA